MCDQILQADYGLKRNFFSGIKMGIPVAIGYLPIAIAFGALAKSFAIPNHITLMMSLFIFAGASQFIGINLLIAGVSSWEILITTFIINFRHFLMTASLSQRISDQTSKMWLALLSFGVTDETFSVASTCSDRYFSPYFLLGLNLISFVSWNVGTWVGVFLAQGLPQTVQNSMGIALYSMFIGLLIPSLTKFSSVRVIVFITIIISAILHWVLPNYIELSPGWNIIIATVISAAIGVLLFPDEGDVNE